MNRSYLFVMLSSLMVSLISEKALSQSFTPVTYTLALEAYESLPGNLTKNFGTKCGDRAHIWSYLLKKKFNIDSKKLFLYYTKKSFNFTGMLWGFHVATLINIDGQEHVVEKIPAFEIVTEPRWNFVLKDNLIFETPVPLNEWLKTQTGFDSCQTLDMNNSDDKHEFKAFNSIKTYKSSTADCVIAKTPSAHWWPNSVYRAVYKNDTLEDDAPDAYEVGLACKNTMPGIESESAVSCRKLLN